MIRWSRRNWRYNCGTANGDGSSCEDIIVTKHSVKVKEQTLPEVRLLNAVTDITET